MLVGARDDLLDVFVDKKLDGACTKFNANSGEEDDLVAAHYE